MSAAGSSQINDVGKCRAMTAQALDTWPLYGRAPSGGSIALVRAGAVRVCTARHAGFKCRSGSDFYRLRGRSSAGAGVSVHARRRCMGWLPGKGLFVWLCVSVVFPAWPVTAAGFDFDDVVVLAEARAAQPYQA